MERRRRRPTDAPHTAHAAAEGPGALSSRLGANVAQLRQARGLTQSQIARAAELPRATWQHIESGAANPTLQVLHRVAAALQVSIEELVAPPRRAARLWPCAELPARVRGAVAIRKLLPIPIPGMEIERMELPARARLTGIPHTPGTTEYLTCESGALVLTAGGEEYRLGPGDVVVFPGDQRHAYANPTERAAIGYAVVVFARP